VDQYNIMEKKYVARMGYTTYILGLRNLYENELKIYGRGVGSRNLGGNNRQDT
jgi:hypothetical protein